MHKDEKDDVPAWVQEAFRDELIRLGGGEFFQIFPLHDQISRFRFFLDTLEEFISAEEKKEVEQLKTHAINLTDVQKSYFWAENDPVHWDEIFRSKLRCSFVISLVSFAETKLEEICLATAIIFRSAIKSNDLKGNIFRRSKKFLDTFGKFNKPADSEWELMGKIYDVRNVLVHNNGFISPDRPQNRLFQFINEQSGLSQENNFIKIEKEFCIFCLERIYSFLKELQQEVKDLCERVKCCESK